MFIVYSLLSLPCFTRELPTIAENTNTRDPKPNCQNANTCQPLPLPTLCECMRVYARRDASQHESMSTRVASRECSNLKDSNSKQEQEGQEAS